MRSMDKKEFENASGELVESRSREWGKYFSFVPSKLPPEIDFDSEFVLALSDAEAALSRLSGAAVSFPNPHLLVEPYMTKEAVSSSRIEGTLISLDGYFLAEAQKAQKKIEDALEVMNYINAMYFGLREIKEKPISLELIKNMHGHLMDNVRGQDRSPGNFRKIQNWIGSRTGPRSASFVPPPAKKVRSLMQGMIDYMNSYHGIPVLVKCALLHYQFETIHPFEDGNGRIGRALIILYLIKKKRLSKPLLYISGFFEKYKSEYSGLLLETSKTGNFREWIMFFLEAIKVQSEEAFEKAIKIQKLREKYLRFVHTSAALKVIDHLFNIPCMTIAAISAITKTSYPTSKKIVNTLADLGILTEMKRSSRRKKVYAAQEILEIISD